ncbi:hypothetical protein SERLA73DRAFT_78354 [Serpula lacrymans var. lacrymans S7.3]|uniref:BTB domain-containing protein n=2 Tax=Serpula lacrymans var. lacrymans TaxID=341189 RepID=F8QCV6_SERL3|nr:uncharacterized protein SERLADRAFT_443388 [Serpula lacrymans var. lacrymans S7.9]EGN93971.1 hypothetical protein SERLA73DRAFT_78354 [Serpula lacrymans var. lacrymans S7.3]EGO19337.1 hypothetical protein SERLADRAFT_443388 [Serpula lacrymans var. lacrymans S7.9]
MVGDPDTGVSRTPEVMESSKSTIHDDVYYIDDGDCVIQVGDTLFKVHRWVLSRDTSAFSDMFVVSGGGDKTHSDGELEGSSDTTPIFLQGDSVEQFRSLLWVLPNAILTRSSFITTDNVEFLAQVAEIAHKYQFSHIEERACVVLCEVPSNKAFWHSGVDSASRLLDISYICQDDCLRSKLLEAWIPRLLSRSIPAIPALLIADKYELQSLQGAAYYSYILRMDEMNSNGRLSPESLLNQIQYNGLLRGYWWLSHTSPLENIPTYERSSKCLGSVYCSQSWRSLWGKSCANLDVSPGIHRLDVLGKMRCATDAAYKQVSPSHEDYVKGDYAQGLFGCFVNIRAGI